MIKDFILEIFKFIGELNYWHIGLLSALESTAMPVIIPVETIIIPMGYYAYLGQKHLPLLMLSCTIGIVVGCLINYWFARAVGRTFIYKHAKFLHINVERLQKLEEKFLKHSRLLMFVGRFVPIPAFKHIITIPAGMSKMPVVPFVFYNALGGFIFSTSMLLIGYFFGSSEELVHQAIGKFTIACVIVVVMYVIVKIIIKLVIMRREKKLAIKQAKENLQQLTPVARYLKKPLFFRKKYIKKPSYQKFRERIYTRIRNRKNKQTKNKRFVFFKRKKF